MDRVQIKPIKKIVFLLPSLKFGGAERVAITLAHAFKAKDIHVTFFLMVYEGEFLEEARKNFEVVNLRCNRTWKLPGKLSFHLWKVRPDVLISSFWKLNLCACLARLAYPAMRLLLWEHAEPSKYVERPVWRYSFTASMFYQLGSKVIAVSTGVQNDISRMTAGLRSKLKVIYNPIPAPVDVLAESSTQESGRRIVWVGRMDYPKNPELMLEAFALLQKDCGFTLDFIGDGRQRAALESRVDELGLRQHVRFRGYQANPYVWMKQSDLLALTSDAEGLPTVLIEALYCGLRIVSTDCGGGVSDILLGERYGSVVSVGNAQALASAISTEFNKVHNKEMQIDGARRFLPELIAEQYLNNME